MKIPFTLLVLSVAGFTQAETQLTIYNRNFGSVKEIRVLDLKQGVNEVRETDVTAHLEPESVVLRDLDKPDAIQILEQNYESDPLGQGLLLRKSEGKVLDFEITTQTGERKIVKGKILRSAYVPHSQAYQNYGQQYVVSQAAYVEGGGGEPIVEVDGKIRFGLPGQPLFDALDPKAFLKPTLLWRLKADRAGKHKVELSYLTGGMRWEANYNAIAPEKGDNFEITGWITVENMSGKDFENASVKLMAGDVSRVRPSRMVDLNYLESESRESAKPSVTEKTFEEYHLYTLERPTTVLDREIKQVEFIRASNVLAQRVYIYDGFEMDERFRGWGYDNIRSQADYGTKSNPKVWTILEFKNTEKSHLGMPLPKGKVKVYRRDNDGRSEFVGEDQIDHTPQDETVRLYTGNAFDIVGERRQIAYKISSNEKQSDETFEIKVRNHKKEAVTVRVVEHLYRWMNWNITTKSMDFSKTDAKTIEFRPQIPPGGETGLLSRIHG